MATLFIEEWAGSHFFSLEDSEKDFGATARHAYLLPAARAFGSLNKKLY